MLTETSLNALQSAIEIKRDLIRIKDHTISRTLTKCLQGLTDLTLLPIEINLQVGNYKESKDFGDTENYTLRFEVNFMSDDLQRVSKGYKADFGSSFDVEITKHNLYVNCGTCGSYCKKDKFQVARVKLIAKLFDYEKTLLSLVESLVDLKLLVSLEEDNRKLYKHEAEQRIKEREDKINEASSQLEKSVGKMLINYCSHVEYENNLPVHTLKVDPSNCYYIKKITPQKVVAVKYFRKDLEDKNFEIDLTSNYNQTQWLSKDTIISNLMCQASKLIDNKDFDLNEIIRYGN